MTIAPEIERRLEDLGASSDNEKMALAEQALQTALEDLEDVQMAERVLAASGPTAVRNGPQNLAMPGT